MLIKMTITGQLDGPSAARFARRIVVAYALAALGITSAGLAGLVLAIRW